MGIFREKEAEVTSTAIIGPVHPEDVPCILEAASVYFDSVEDTGKGFVKIEMHGREEERLELLLKAMLMLDVPFTYRVVLAPIKGPCKKNAVLTAIAVATSFVLGYELGWLTAPALGFLGVG